MVFESAILFWWVTGESWSFDDGSGKDGDGDNATVEDLARSYYQAALDPDTRAATADMLEYSSGP